MASLLQSLMLKAFTMLLKVWAFKPPTRRESKGRCIALCNNATVHSNPWIYCQLLLQLTYIFYGGGKQSMWNFMQVPKTTPVPKLGTMMDFCGGISFSIWLERSFYFKKLAENSQFVKLSEAWRKRHDETVGWEWVLIVRGKSQCIKKNLSIYLSVCLYLYITNHYRFIRFWF